MRFALINVISVNPILSKKVKNVNIETSMNNIIPPTSIIGELIKIYFKGNIKVCVDF